MIGKDIFWHNHKVNRQERESLNSHRGCVLWFYGLSGSGKSTIASELESILFQKKIHTYILDGDNFRHGLSHGLGFSEEDRLENVRRASEAGKLFVDAGLIVMACFVTPFERQRQIFRDIIGKDLIEVYVSTPISICEERDTKGLYKKARAGELQNFSGINQPFEVPNRFDYEAGRNLENDIQNLKRLLISRGVIND